MKMRLIVRALIRILSLACRPLCTGPSGALDVILLGPADRLRAGARVELDLRSAPLDLGVACGLCRRRCSSSARRSGIAFTGAWTKVQRAQPNVQLCLGARARTMLGMERCRATEEQ